MDKEDYYRFFCSDPKFCRCPLTKDCFTVIQEGAWPDDETLQRIRRVLFLAPVDELLLAAIDVYNLGVMDGKRLERSRKRATEQTPVEELRELVRDWVRKMPKKELHKAAKFIYELESGGGRG